MCRDLESETDSASGFLRVCERTGQEIERGNEANCVKEVINAHFIMLHEYVHS